MPEDTIKFEEAKQPSKGSDNNSSFLTGVLVPAVVILVVILGGVGTGWFLSDKTDGLAGVGTNISAAPGTDVVSGGKEFGLKDEGTFRDDAEGILEEGGIEGEGTHHLVRDGGPSKYVYLTSSVVDLSELEGKKVQVWGETFGAKKAGWLMDVGRVKILD